MLIRPSESPTSALIIGATTASAVPKATSRMMIAARMPRPSEMSRPVFSSCAAGVPV